jgi:hypothetical protein
MCIISKILVIYNTRSIRTDRTVRNTITSDMLHTIVTTRKEGGERLPLRLVPIRSAPLRSAGRRKTFSAPLRWKAGRRRTSSALRLAPSAPLRSAGDPITRRSGSENVFRSAGAFLVRSAPLVIRWKAGGAEDVLRSAPIRSAGDPLEGRRRTSSAFRLVRSAPIRSAGDPLEGRRSGERLPPSAWCAGACLVIRSACLVPLQSQLSARVEGRRVSPLKLLPIRAFYFAFPALYGKI